MAPGFRNPLAGLLPAQQSSGFRCDNCNWNVIAGTGRRLAVKKLILALSLIAVVAVAPLPVYSQNTNLPPDPTMSGDFWNQYMGERIIVDVFILRPLGVVARAFGMAASIPAYPWAAMSNSTDRVCRELIQRPLDYTFKRPVGDIDF